MIRGAAQLACAICLVVIPAPADALECSHLGPALVDHTCFHARRGPFVSVTAGAAARPTSDTLNNVHTYYSVALDAATASAMISYTPARSGEWAIFTQYAVPLAVRDSAGAALPVQLRDAVPTCPFLAQVLVVTLDAGTSVQIAIGPTSVSEIGVVIEKLDDFVEIQGRDRDGDRYGDPDEVQISPCLPADGYADNDRDCDDSDPAVHPGAEERCDDVDRNCNGVPGDIGAACKAGVGSCAVNAVAACPVSGMPPVCNGTPAPATAEQCNGVDDDCDGIDDAAETLCGDADLPRCVPDGAGGRLCGCETDGDCGGPQSGRLCSLRGTEQRCIDGCVDGFDRNSCPTGLVCSSRDPARPGVCGAVAHGDGCATASASSVGMVLALLLLLSRRRPSRRISVVVDH